MQWRRELSWNPHDLNWRIAAPFMIGSFLFVLGSFPPYSQLVDGRVVGMTFVVGSVFFMAAAIASFTLKTTGEPVNITIVNIGIFAGVVCFLVGSYVTLPPHQPARISIDGTPATEHH